MSSAASRMRRKRERARVLALCITCFVNRVCPGRSVCPQCNLRAKERIYRRRKARYHDADQTGGTRALEVAGDLAAKRYDYDDARRYYAELARSASSGATYLGRIAEKLANATYLGDFPHRATNWFEVALQNAINLRDSEHASIVLLRIARQHWLDSETQSAIPIIERAIELSGQTRNRATSVRTKVALAHYLILLGRFDEARPILAEVGEPARGDDPELRAIYLGQNAIAHAAMGERDIAFQLFERAVLSATEIPDGYLVTSVWDDFALWAFSLGDLVTARACREWALLVARERNIGWRTAYLSLRYAALLTAAGDEQRALSLVRDATIRRSETPAIRVLGSATSIEIALRCGDDSLLAQYADEACIDLAFCSGEDSRIASVCAAFSDLYHRRGARDRASRLVDRAVHALRTAEHTWPLLARAGGHENTRTRNRARELLEARLRFPNHEVAAAWLKLHLAYGAASAHNQERCSNLAREAATVASKIGLESAAREAHALAASEGAVKNPSKSRLLGGLWGDLTPRERQVADLALQGLTNREIACQLAISAHTVEAHMSSILNRLGIRSRWQLVASSSTKP